jgi:hypothetical protein
MANLIFPKQNRNKNKKTNRGPKGGLALGTAKSYNITQTWPRASNGDQRQQLLRVNLEYSVTAFATSIVSPTLGSLLTSLSNYAGYAKYADLFDQYRFVSIEAWINPPASQSTPGAPEIGTWVTTVDLDDSTAPASYAGCSMAQGAMQTSVLSAHYHHFKPSIDVAAYSGVFTSYANLTDQWIDCSSASVNQYGLKYAVSATSTAMTFNVIYRAVVEFRGISA